MRDISAYLDDINSEYAGALDTALSVLSPAVAEPFAGWAGIMSGGDPEAVRYMQERMTWAPKTEEGRRNLGYLAEGMQSALDYQPPLSDQTIGEQLQSVGDYWRDTSVPALQDVFGEEGGAGIGALGLGVLGTVGLPARGGASARAARKLLDQDISPDQFRRDMLKRGMLTPEEVDLMPKNRELAIARTIDENPGMNAEELAEVALAGWPKRGWYRDSAQSISELFGDDAPRFAYLLSALSPQTSVESNLKNAVNVWTDWVAAGRPKDKGAILDIMGQAVEGDKGVESVLGAWRNNAFRALTADDMKDIRFSGPKVSSFARNLVGNLGEVTNDAWMARALDVDQDIFGGAASKAFGADEFGSLGGQGAGYTAANAVTRDAANILTKRLKDQGIVVEPAEIQETVWSYTKPLWEARDAEGNLRSIGQLAKAGVLSDEAISNVPDFGSLLSNTPAYRSSLESVGIDFGNLTPHAGATQRPVVPQPARLSRFHKRLEDRYRRETIPSELGRSVNAILQGGSEQFTDPGRLRSYGWTEGVRGRPIDITEQRGRRFESLGIDTPRLLQMEPGEAAGALFNRYGREAADATPFGTSVDIYDPEKYSNLDMYLAPGGGAGFALDEGNIVSAFKHPGFRSNSFAQYMLPAAINQGGRYLDAFDTVLPSLYSQAGFKPSSRIGFNPEYAPEGWDYGAYGRYNEGRPDVVNMVLDPANAEPIPVGTGPYAKRSKTWREAREGILYPDWGGAKKAQMQDLTNIVNSGRYKNYESGFLDRRLLPWLGLLGGGGYLATDWLKEDIEESDAASAFRPREY